MTSRTDPVAPLVTTLAAEAGDGRPWGLILGLLALAVVLLGVGLLALRAARRAQRSSR